MRYYTLNNGRNGRDFICGDSHEDLMQSLKRVCDCENEETTLFMLLMAERIQMQGGEAISVTTEQAFIDQLVSHEYLILQDIQ